MFQKTRQAESRSKEEQLLKPKTKPRQEKPKIIHSLKDLTKTPRDPEGIGQFRYSYHSFQVTTKTQITQHHSNSLCKKKKLKGRVVHARFFGAARRLRRAKLNAFFALANLPSGFSLRTSILGGGGWPLIFLAGLSSTNDGLSS